MTEIMPHKKELLSLLGDLENAIVLDYGCGTGDFIELILKQGANKIHAVDVCSSVISEINSKFQLPITEGILSTQVIKNPSFIEGKFNKIICHNVLECVGNKVDFINKFDPLLLPNGVFLLSHHDFDSAIYNSLDKKLTRDLIHHFADTQQDWQEHCDGQMGRKIPGIISQSVFKDQTDYVVLRKVERKFTPGSYGYLMAEMIIEVASRRFKSELIKKWRADLEHVSQLGEYYFSIDLVAALIRK